MSCDHKFIGGSRCAKCGWEPPPKRTANERAPDDWLTLIFDGRDCRTSIVNLDNQLAERGLHVVSAADKAVLDAMADLRSEWLIAMLRSDRTFPIEPICVARVRLHEAELARREKKP